MRKGRRIRKEDIGDPSNFVHVNHVGFGSKKSSIPTQKSFDMDPDHDCSSTTEESSTTNARVSVENEDELSEQHYPVERRNKGHRSSLIPRHHRSTTTCIFPPENPPYQISRGHKSSLRNHRDSNEAPSTPSGDGKSSLKPTFGSLLNLSFLPLGLGKSSSKSPSVGKAKRMSLLNLTASNLFANPKANYEENRESVHMTSYVRRRSFSNSNDEFDDGETVKPVQVQNEMENSGKPQIVLNTQAPKSNGSTRIPLAKLGRSKSSMSELTKRPKLRLKIPPPMPPPKPPRDTIKNRQNEAETLPSPPPSPIPSPPPSPDPASPPYMEVALRKSPKTTPRPRIIPLPSASSHDSLDQDPEQSSPQFLTPAGGNSPLSTNEASFPLLLSPTIPPSSTPFFPTSSSAPGTPPVWPLQPIWPNSLPMQKEATIPEIPSPRREEMETSENDSYDPVVSIVDSFITCGEESLSDQNVENTEDTDRMNSVGLHLAITTSNINSISSILRENVDYIHWPQLAHKLFQSIPKVPSSDNVSCLTSSSPSSGNDTYGCLLTKTLELWLEKAGDEAVVEKLVTVLNEENHHQATESLRKVFGDLHM